MMERGSREWRHIRIAVTGWHERISLADVRGSCGALGRRETRRCIQSTPRCPPRFLPPYPSLSYSSSPSMVGSGGGGGVDSHASFQQYDDGIHRLVGTPHIRGPSHLQLPLLALGFFGFQMVWSIEMAYGTPFLLELGLSKSTMAIVFIAGPISGLVVQPLIGTLADSSTHPWGRRRPYLVAATLVTAAFVLLFGFARLLPALLGMEVDQAGWATPILAVVGIWGMDFAVNAMMALDRSLLLDMLPKEKQADGTAWSARLATLGAILGE